MLFLPTLLKGIGAGISALSGFSSSSQTRATGAVNYGIAGSNAALMRSTELAALDLDRSRSLVELDNVRMNTQIALLDAQAREQNAARIRSFGEATTDKSREAIRRQRREFNRFQGRQEAIIGKSGVAFTGSAIDVLAESAGQMELALNDMRDEANARRTETMNQAELESFAGRQIELSARSTLASAQAGNALNASAVHFGKLAANQRYSTAMFAAQMGQDITQQSARGNTLGTFAQLGVSTAGIIANRAVQTGYTTPTFKATT